MRQMYKTSGKISAVFFPVFFLTAIAIVPLISALYVFLVWYVPSSFLDIVIYVLCILILAELTVKLCIKTGKVRNQKAAVWTGILLFLWFAYLSVVLFHSLSVKQLEPSQVLSAFLHPERLTDTLKSLVSDGYAIQTFRKGTLQLYKGPFMVIGWVIKFLPSIVYMGFYPYYESIQPFCEDSKKWYRNYVIILEAVRDVEEFKKQLLLGNSIPLQSLETLQETNTDYCEAILYVPRGNSPYYITLINKIRVEGTGEEGKVKYRDEDIIRLLSIERETAAILSGRGERQDVIVSARLENSRTRAQDRRSLAKTAVFSILQIGMLILLAADHDTMVQVFSNVGVLFYLCVNILVWAINLWRSFIKEIVLEDEGEIYKGRSVKRWQLTKRKIPLYYRLFYLLMFLISLFLLLYCVKEIYL